MKIQLLILGLLVIATLAHRRKGDDENQIGTRRHYRGSRRNDNQISANAENDVLEGAVSSKAESIDERTHKERCGSAWKRGEIKGNYRNKLRHNSKWHQNGETNEEQNHDQEWHEKYGVSLPDKNNDVERKHHRHHHHHHHHKNRTTSTTTTSTVAPSFAEVE